jgi:phosphomannomutase
MALHHFGTDGVRGVAGVSLTAEMAYRIGRYIGQYPKGKVNRIIISRDTRESGQMLLDAIVKGMLASAGPKSMTKTSRPPPRFRFFASASISTMAS